MTAYGRTFILLTLAIAIVIGVTAKSKRAKFCSEEKCKLPDCRCAGLPLPSADFENKVHEIPQFITITFDDAVTAEGYDEVEKLLKDIVNPDQCPAKATFYISHEYSDYVKINALYTSGHEIALHSITHTHNFDYWRNADDDLITREFGNQMDILEQYGKVKREHIKGMRLPFLQMSTNNTFAAAQRLGLTYDSSWPTQDYRGKDAMWPYTLDYHSVQDCMIKPCPTTPVPGFWMIPMVAWIDDQNYYCAMIDGCHFAPKDSIDQIYQWMLKHFLLHYNGNRAPFGMFLHAGWLKRNPFNLAAFRKFLLHVNKLPQVYITTSSRLIEYMRNPVLGKPFKDCVPNPTARCKAKNCVVIKDTTNEVRYINVCDRCPNVYPWLENALGE